MPNTSNAKAPVFDKVAAGGKWGAAAAVLVTLAQTVFPDLRIPEGAGPEETIGRIAAHLLPVVVAFVAAYLKREKTGYGSTVAVVTSGDAPPVVQPSSSGAYTSQPGADAARHQPQEPTRRDRFGEGR